MSSRMKNEHRCRQYRLYTHRFSIAWQSGGTDDTDSVDQDRAGGADEMGWRCTQQKKQILTNMKMHVFVEPPHTQHIVVHTTRNRTNGSDKVNCWHEYASTSTSSSGRRSIILFTVDHGEKSQGHGAGKTNRIPTSTIGGTAICKTDSERCTWPR